ncbi:hypothetical protein AB4156_21825 [Cupriavidus sp. 2MCAB6]|uniref:hypothetical protein n=1 Tax=Cupriavidus sp. 2MCAB6 TaxID=3232981 RepID=UPI003F8EBB9B
MLKKMLVTLSAWALVGCAPLDLSRKAPLELNSDETLVLVAARVSNTREPKYPIKLFGITFERSPLMFSKSGTATEAATTAIGPPENQTFLIAAKVKAGDNEMTWLSGLTERTTAPGFGSMRFGVSAPFTAMPGKVQYLGFLDIENVDRKNKDQQPSGPGAPILDQAITGLAMGTLAIRLSDESQRDIGQFRRAFATLAMQAIQIAPLQQITLEPRTIKPALNQGFDTPAEPEVVRLQHASN